jgi:protein-L-isoaspartate(D-aspartate) O-methyltransferase
MKAVKRELELMIKSIQINNPGISEEILGAFHICDRSIFVKTDSYGDIAQHIAHNQTISQPSTVARMIHLLNLDKGLNILEVGTNTGYHAALVAYLIYPGIIRTIEIFPDLAQNAKKNLKKLKKKQFSKLKIYAGDALNKKNSIWKHKYDRIYFTAGVDSDKINKVKKMALALLKNNGLILYPTRKTLAYGSLEMWQKKKNQLKLVLKEEGYAFVPLLNKEELEVLYRKKR